MPELKWNEYNFVECLGVLPETDEFFCSWHFTVIKDDLKLDLSLWQNESCIAVSISKVKSKTPFITFYFIVRDEVKLKKEKDVLALIFNDIVFVESRFWIERVGKYVDYFDKGNVATKNNFVISTFPKLEFKVE